MTRIRRKRWITLAVILAAVAGVSVWLFTPASAKTDDSVLARVKKGDFHVVVTSAGELRAKKFVQVQGPDSLLVRTFERGSGETLACGTGAVVAAAAARQQGRVRAAAVAVRLRGGSLRVVGEGSTLAIEGPARTVFTGEIALPESG